jgi:hypothetical protein
MEETPKPRCLRKGRSLKATLLEDVRTDAGDTKAWKKKQIPRAKNALGMTVCFCCLDQWHD